MKRLIAEQEQYNDLIVTDVEESYENLVLKVYSVMVFFQQYCISATFLMKVDDDVLIHLDRMFSRWIETDDDENSIFCIVWPQHEPIRDPRNKWLLVFSFSFQDGNLILNQICVIIVESHSR
ncbi:hypothetical protein ANCDUO_12063 [Ancylostoma duodenale]|uniref:Hexosyltransferase n=1 Tax=Ancylostoma duodenale TaxID=51022 RepID=A0A0C2CMA7_9BILA|nr:hypothetical protein ANCDUO_12063 [Ancylostoma duodenale]